jgi:hypothetical protein
MGKLRDYRNVLFKIFNRGSEMLVRRCVLIFLVPLLLVGAPLLAQNTNSSSTDLDIVSPLSGDDNLRVEVPAYLMADNRVGSLVSAWSTGATVDSILSYADGQEMYWVVSVESFSADSIAILKIEELRPGSSKVLKVYRETVDWGARSTAHREDSLGSAPMGLNITVCAASAIAPLSQTVRSSWRWYLYLSKTKTIDGSRDGAVATWSKPMLDTLTISGRDTLAEGSLGDTLFTKAIPGSFGYVTLFIQGDSAAAVNISSQVKYNGGDWAGPLDTTFAFFSILDNVVVSSTGPKAYWTSGTPSDSTRFVIINKMDGRGLIQFIKALWRD